MQRFIHALIVTAAVVLAGCSSAPKTDSAVPQAATAPAVQPRLAAAVKIPAASARKVVLVMTGPKSTVESKDWPDFKREWRDTFSESAKQAGVEFAFVETPPATGVEDGTVLTVTVADYRIVGIGMRIMFGIMTGNAFIDAKVTFSSLRDNSVFGEQQYNTSSSASGGIFSRVTPQQVDQIATSVFVDIKNAK
jgi:uncharacterized lipoprotein YmbA